MPSAWVPAAREVAASIADSAHVAPSERWLTDRLLEFVFEPTDPSAATIELLASADQFVLFAGQGARFELDGPESANHGVEELARAVVRGGLTERIGRRRAHFVLRLGDGRELSGSSTLRRDRPTRQRGTHRYAPYPTTDLD